jgi:putative ABC transport system permease protein
MFKNHLEIAWRNIARHKVNTLINVAGLALGISTCIVIFLFCSFELSFDNFHQDKEQIYHIGSYFQQQPGEGITSRIPPAMPNRLRNEMTGLEAVASWYPYDASIAIRNNGGISNVFNSGIEGSGQTTLIITDPHYFDIFKYQWLVGSPATSLKDPFQVVLSESKAIKYFGSISFKSIIGREIIYNDSLRATVSGIVKDWTTPSDFPFSEFISYSSINSSSFLKTTYSRTDAWGIVSGINPWMWSMVKLSKKTTIASTKNQLDAFVKKHIPADQDNKLNFLLQPLSDIHFNADYSHDDIRKAHKPTLYILMGVALFILLLAVINFVNLSTAQSIQRAKEIGIRKILGSSRISLRLQFLIETFVISLFATVVATSMVEPILSFFQDFIPAGVTFHLFKPETLIFLFLLTLGTSLLAGLYPAKVLSSYLPALSLKGGNSQPGGEKWWMRKGLIVFQFSISLIFIIGTIVIGRQINYMLNTDYGFKSDAILGLFTSWRESTSKLKVFEEKIKQLPGVEKLVLQGAPPAGWVEGYGEIEWMGKKPLKLWVREDAGNEEFIPFYHMRIVAGRNIAKTDSLAEFVINETCMKNLGFARPEDALGQFVWFHKKPYPIVGVVADFHEGSFRDQIKPLIIGHNPEEERLLGIQLATNGKRLVNVHALLAAVEKIYRETYPHEDYMYKFIDDGISEFYENEQKTSRLMQAAMLITIFISCLGLFGLALFTAQKKTREIGIRKVIGANVTDIVSLLTRDFILLVFIAFLIASPIAWFFMNRWLQGFAYRITINWWVFALAGSAAMLIGTLTVSFQAVKAALANPVKSLRTE